MGVRSKADPISELSSQHHNKTPSVVENAVHVSPPVLDKASPRGVTPMTKLLLTLTLLLTSSAWAQLASYKAPSSFVGKPLVDRFVAGTGLTDYTCTRQAYGTTCNLRGTGEKHDLGTFGQHLLRFVNRTRVEHPEFGLLGFEREPNPGEKRITYVLRFDREGAVKRISVGSSTAGKTASSSLSPRSRCTSPSRRSPGGTSGGAWGESACRP